MSDTVVRPQPGTRLRGFSGGVILLVGVLLIPLALSVIFDSSATPDAAAYVRMAFAQVAGATIAIVTVRACSLTASLGAARGARSPDLLSSPSWSCPGRPGPSPAPLTSC
ncbi:hypothetical protein [Microbacterium sp. P05]|uniref:hypothetical protein n=1 Tax=Microbacterium sp. P05 TaxID=3366948 RepID=UPI003744DDAD